MVFSREVVSKTLRSIALGLLFALRYALLTYPSDAERIPLLGCSSRELRYDLPWQCLCRRCVIPQ